jgi:hypothetical protein
MFMNVVYFNPVRSALLIVYVIIDTEPFLQLLF